MNGIILIDKPKEYTSHDVVAIVKKTTKEKVGHTGTLDPMATGVLPLLIGKATQISKYLINHDKTYITTLKLGVKTDTADSEGKVIDEKEIPELYKEKITDTLNSMIGMQEQVPPIYSAIKVNGKKLYEYAREGKSIQIKPRIIEIYSIHLIEINQKEAEIKFKISCSKGTYIRTVCEDIAKRLGALGYMKELRRTEVGEFKITDSINMEQIKRDENLLKERIISIEEFFNDKEEIKLNTKELILFLNGVKISKQYLDGVYRIYSENKFIGIGVVEKNKLKRDVII